MSQFDSTAHPHPSRDKKGAGYFFDIADNTGDEFLYEILPVDTAKAIPTYHKHSLKVWYITSHKTQHMHEIVLKLKQVYTTDQVRSCLEQRILHLPTV